MSFTIVSTVTDKGGTATRWRDRGRGSLSNGLPIGLLLILTYTQ